MAQIELEFRYTEDEAVRAVAAITKSTFKFIAVMPWIGGILLALVLILALVQEVPALNFIVLLLVGVLFILMPALTARSAKRNFRKNPSANKTIRWTISEQGLRNETEGAETQFTWEMLLKVEERKAGFLLFIQPRLAHWIPKNSFGGGEELNAFRDLVRNQGIAFKAPKHVGT